MDERSSSEMRSCLEAFRPAWCTACGCLHKRLLWHCIALLVRSCFGWLFVNNANHVNNTNYTTHTPIQIMHHTNNTNHAKNIYPAESYPITLIQSHLQPRRHLFHTHASTAVAAIASIIIVIVRFCRHYWHHRNLQHRVGLCKEAASLAQSRPGVYVLLNTRQMLLCLNIALNSCRTCDAMWYGAIRYDAIHPGPVPIPSQIPLYHRYHVTCSFPGLVRYTYKKIGNLEKFIVKFIRRSDSLRV